MPEDPDKTLTDVLSIGLKLGDIAYRCLGRTLPSSLGDIIIYTLPEQQGVTIDTIFQRTFRVDLSVDHSNLPEGVPVPEDGPGMVVDHPVLVRTVISDEGGIYMAIIQVSKSNSVVLFANRTDIEMFSLLAKSALTS